MVFPFITYIYPCLHFPYLCLLTVSENLPWFPSLYISIKDCCPEISTQDLVRSLSSWTRGDPRDQLASVFRIYDVDGDGMISRSSLMDLLDSVCDLHSCGSASDVQKAKHVELIFQVRTDYSSKTFSFRAMGP